MRTAAPAGPTGRLQSMAVLATVAVLGGCAAMDSYNQAGRYVAPGGVGDQQKVAAQTGLQAAHKENTDLQVDVAQREREIQQVNERLRTAETDLAAQTRALDAAVKARRVSLARAEPIRKEMEAIRGEMQRIDALNKAAVAARPDPVVDEQKRKHLADLDARRKALEATLAQMGGASR
jgi:hypothetical protein